MNETDLMFLEAFEDLKPYWDPKDGDIIYFEYSEKDKEFWKKQFEEANKPYEQKDGYWYVDNNIEFKNDGTKRYSEHLKKEAKAWRARQEDLQKIKMDQYSHTPYRVLTSFNMWYHDLRILLRKHDGSDFPDSRTDITILWLLFVMEKRFKKQWNRKTNKWEVLP